MKKITPGQFQDITKKAKLKSRLKSELRFGTSTNNLGPEDWQDRELVCVTDRSGNKGILLLQPDDELFIVPYEISKGISDKQTGRYKPIICGFCGTWQAGSNSATISFVKTKQTTVGYLCCADLACSEHVRTKTPASIKSRSQLHEDINNEQRTERLKRHLRALVKSLGLAPISLEKDET